MQSTRLRVRTETCAYERVSVRARVLPMSQTSPELASPELASSELFSARTEMSMTSEASPDPAPPAPSPLRCLPTASLVFDPDWGELRGTLTSS